MNEERLVVRKEWRAHPKCSILWCETAFIERVGIGARKVTTKYVLKQIETIEIVIETFYSLYMHCMGDAMQFASCVRGIGGVHAIADMQQTIHATQKGRMTPLIKYGLRFVVLRVALRSVSMLHEMADALSMSRARTLIYLLSAAYYAVRTPLFEATYANVYRAVYSSAARPVRNTAPDLSRDSRLHREP